MNMFLFVLTILILNNIMNKYLIVLYIYILLFKNGKNKSKSNKIKKGRGK